VILDALARNAQMGRSARIHIARADLLTRLHRNRDAVGACRLALELEPPAAERAFIGKRIRALSSGKLPP
jgi:RNA polymerase sigma-70 factor, ECF subfamily